MPKYGQARPADRQLRLPRVILGRISRGGCGPAGNPHTREDRRQKVGLARLATHCKASSLTSHVTAGFGIGQEFRIKSAHHARQTAVICTLEALPIMHVFVCSLFGALPTILIYIYLSYQIGFFTVFSINLSFVKLISGGVFHVSPLKS